MERIPNVDVFASKNDKDVTSAVDLTLILM